MNILARFLRYGLCSMFLLVSVLSQAQYWAKGAGGLSNDAFTDLVTDAAGNSYVTGEFGGVMQLNPGSITTYGSLDAIVAKYDPSGVVVWAKHFGGPGLDRGIALELGPNGELVVVGQFMAQATFGPNTLTSMGSTQDVFTLSLDASTGDVNWVRGCGGADGVDQPNGVSIAPNGSIAVTGEFRGTAVFDTQTLVSVPDPETGDPSVDIFVQTYGSDGSTGWLKHGAAEFADRGMDVEHDAAGNVYVTGQFSDTLAFDLVHTNAMYSAVFLMRFSPSGTEEWFRVFGGGTYNQVHDMLHADGHLLLTGDIQGTVIFQDDQPDIFTATQPRSSFLIDVSLIGELINRTTWGSDNFVSTRSLCVKGDEIAVLGLFSCQFTGLSALYGNGTFLATAPRDLYVARFTYPDLVFVDAQQFGGAEDKLSGAIFHMPDDALVFCGAFQRLLVFPSVPGMDVEPEVYSLYGTQSPNDYCQDLNYRQYSALAGSGLRDAFLARGVVPGRAPYEIFHREGTTCDRTQLGVTISDYYNSGVAGPDSIVHCEEAHLMVDLPIASDPNYPLHSFAGPKIQVIWEDGSTFPSHTVTSTGWYSVVVTSLAGCWQRSDSIHVTINALPERPLISDDQGVNTEALETTAIVVCAPIAPWLWATGIAPGDTVRWEAPPATANDSVQAFQSGWYGVEVINGAGCVRHNSVQVLIRPNEPLPDLEALYAITFPQDTDLNDTIVLCPGQDVIARAPVTLLQGVDTIGVPYGVRLLQRCDNGSWEDASWNEGPVLVCTRDPIVAGWQVFQLNLLLTNAPCGDDSLIFSRTESVYVIPGTVTPPTVSLDGPPILCPGDTTQLVLQCANCDSLVFLGPFISEDPDSLLVTTHGTYYVHAYGAGTNGCMGIASDQHTIGVYPRPLLGNYPNDAIICPDSVALVFSDTPGQSYQWYGPLGPMSVSNDTIVTSQPGEYYLEMVDLDGCAVTSDNILITDYATPYLNVLPDGVLCEEGETAELQVVTTSAASLVWSAPLSGNSLTQIVDDPGTYTCSVAACGIVTPLSTVIFGSDAVAELTAPGPYLLCEGSEIELEAVTGQAFYLWMPDQIIGPMLIVEEPGTYQLQAMDMYGCTDTLDVLVELTPVEVPLVITGGTYCAGDEVLFNAQGSGTISWYEDPAGTMNIGSGAVLSVGVAQQPGPIIVYAQQDAGSCTTTLASATSIVLALPVVPVVVGPDTVCQGASLQLMVENAIDDIYSWSTPVGGFTGPMITFDPVTMAHNGNYSVVAGQGACSAQGPIHVVTVLLPEPIYLGPDTFFCDGGLFTVDLPQGFSDAIWSTGTTGPQLVVSEHGLYSVLAMDEQGCAVRDTIALWKIPCEPVLPNVITPNGDGVNDELSFEAGGTVRTWLQVFDRYGSTVWEADPVRSRFKGEHGTSHAPLSEGTYYFVFHAERADGSSSEQRGYFQLLR